MGHEMKVLIFTTGKAPVEYQCKGIGKSLVDLLYNAPCSGDNAYVVFNDDGTVADSGEVEHRVALSNELTDEEEEALDNN